MKNNIETIERFKGCLLGLAAGDAVGTTVEFKPRGSFTPLTDMVGGGPFNLKVGQWTDDTSMALCLATSLIEKRGFDADDQMMRYCRWRNEGYMSSNGRCFDIGFATSDALYLYEDTGNPYAGSANEHSAGNGSLMRLSPIALYFYPDIDKIEYWAAESSKTTHGAVECIDACRLFGRQLARALNGESKEQILFSDAGFAGAEKIQSIARGYYRHKTSEEIYGQGYVARSLEAALWCFLTTDTFKEAILKASNLGDDADTTAAICGQISGAFYGVEGIPADWRAKLTMSDEISMMSESLFHHSVS